MRVMSPGPVTAVLLFGLVAILVPNVNGDAVAAKANASTPRANNSEDEVYTPYQGERFDNFDWSLCKKLSRGYAGNMIVSPISIKMALVLLYEGAHGQTAHELAGALQLPDARASTRDRFVSVLRSLQAVRPEYTFDISTRIIADTSMELNSRYTNIVKSIYSTDVVTANLTDAHVALKDINDWVSNVTHGHIKQVLTDENKLKESVFLVLNALYFRGTWRQPFSPSLTRLGNFFADIDKPVEVSYMSNFGHYRYIDAPELDAQILRLPYRGQKYAMFIVLPRARTGIRQLIENVNPYTLRRLIYQMEDVAVDVLIPKFKFEFTSHLENVLRDLGIRDIFDNTASLSYIVRDKQQGKGIVVSDFVQKAGLEVDEVGTTAQATTVVEIGNKIGDTMFHVKHSFLFFIEDETTGTVLYVGKVMNPLEKTGTLEEPVTTIRMGDGPPNAAPVQSPVKPVQPAHVDERFNFFDIDLLEALTKEGDDNVVVSPASVKAALTTLVEGTGGRTADEILGLLRLPSDAVGIRSAAKRALAPFKTQRVGAELNLATRLWTGNNVEVNPVYKAALRQNYDSDIIPTNFGDPSGSTNDINNWVNQQTQGHIKSIITPGSLSPGTKLLLTNALYLKGTWKTAFDRTLTSVNCFNVPNSGCQNTRFMYSLAYYRYTYSSALHSEVLEIPYTDDKLSMIVILPVVTDGGINQVSRDLAHVSLSSIIDSMEETEIRLALPRFTLESKMDLRQTLEGLGVRDLFDLNANISGITNGAVQVGGFLHNAKMEVNEEGTVAAAVTAAAVVPLMGSTVQRFSANRPFIFIIREADTGGILFAGRVTKPDPVPDQEAENNTTTYRRRVV